MESLQALLDAMDYVVWYANWLRERLADSSTLKNKHKSINDEIAKVTELYIKQMTEYVELIRLLNTIVKYNANEQYHEKKLDDEIKWEIIIKKS